MSSRDTSFEPISSHFQIKDTEYAGRGVFASRHIPKDTVLLKSDFIALSVLNREYRREVCAECFGYERGRNLKLRDSKVNFSYCSPECENQWRERRSSIEISAWESAEALIKTRLQKALSQPVAYHTHAATSDSEDHGRDSPVSNHGSVPNEDEIEKMWASVESTAHFIRQARAGSKLKPHQKAMQAAKTIVPDPTTLYWLLDGVLAHHSSLDEEENRARPNPWKAMLVLASDETPYQSEFHLRQHVYSYLQLLAILPQELLSSVTSQVCREMVKRDVHNSFGIRSLDDEGSEYFGWGVWPDASYFNHSCSPNLAKRRIGRQWQFWAARDIEADEQLFISYLGGDENDLDYTERDLRLDNWGFECSCSRCLDDQAVTLSESRDNDKTASTTAIETLSERLESISVTL
jgi:SET domain